MTSIIAWLLAAIASGIAAYFFAKLRSAQATVQQLEQSNQRAVVAENELAATRALLDRTELEISQARATIESLQQQLFEIGTSEAVAREKLAQAEQVETRMRADREELKERFENLANQIFEQKTNAANTSIQQVIEPLKHQIETFRARIDEVHTADTNQSGELRNALNNLHTLNTQLQKEAETLARALKNEPQTRGRWGELILERTMEIAGLVKGRDYRIQVTEGSSRMDAVVYLPDGRCIVVDSKVPLNDYSAYCDALTDEDREKCLKAHTAAVRGFIDELSRKDYSALLEGKAPDFTIMLIPIEPAFGTAFKADGTLMEYALARRVIPTSTASLVATLRVIENLWKIDAQNKNVQEIAAEGAKLLQYIDVFVAELNEVGDALNKAKDIHDKALRRITLGGQGSVKGTSERLKDLGVKMIAGPTRRRAKGTQPEIAADVATGEKPDGLDAAEGSEIGEELQVAKDVNSGAQQ